MANLTADDVANYFLSLMSDESGDTISNLKLQKLLYFAQGFHLAINDAPLFEETIEKWRHGPVIASIYRQYKEYGCNSIKKPELDESFFDKFTKETREFLDLIYNQLGRYSAWILRDKTHEEPPWKDAQNIITEESMKKYFKTQIKTDE